MAILLSPIQVMGWKLLPHCHVFILTWTVISGSIEDGVPVILPPFLQERKQVAWVWGPRSPFLCLLSQPSSCPRMAGFPTCAAPCPGHGGQPTTVQFPVEFGLRTRDKGRHEKQGKQKHNKNTTKIRQINKNEMALKTESLFMITSLMLLRPLQICFASASGL